MLFDTVREFVAFFSRVGVKASDPRVKEMMVILRRSGLTTPQIVELSGGRLSATLARQYTKGWGGVDDSLAKELDDLMAPLRELVSSDMVVGDVRAVLALDRSVRAKGSSLVEVAELNAGLRGLDMRPGEVGELVSLARDLTENVLTPSVVRAWMARDDELAKMGFNVTTREILLEVSRKHGGVPMALKAFNEFDNLVSIRNRRDGVEADLKQLKVEEAELIGRKNELNLEIGRRKALVDAANMAILAGFDIASLKLASIEAERFGGPYKVLEAIKKYASLTEMDDKLRKVNAELSDRSLMLTAFRNALAVAQQEYERNSDVRLVVALLVNPSGIKQDRLEMTWLLARILALGAQRIEEAPEYPLVPSPAWDIAISNLKQLSVALQAIVDVKPKGP